jgi:tRNA threonylcarbamoyladenosine modification (KEOPS) complex  Pcc1 subunit
MKAKSTICLRFSTAQQAETILKSLEPETEHPATTRSHIAMQKKGKHITLKVEAKDTVALRATLNAHLRWIDSVLNVYKVLETQ